MKKDSLVKFGLEGVMGYFRPVSEFNIGKKSEYAERVCFSEKKAVERFAGISKTQAAE